MLCPLMGLHESWRGYFACFIPRQNRGVLTGTSREFGRTATVRQAEAGSAGAPCIRGNAGAAALKDRAMKHRHMWVQRNYP